MHNTRGNNKCTRAGAYTLVIVTPSHMVTTVQKYCFMSLKKKKEFTQAIKMLPQKENFSVRNINCHNYELSPDALKYENYNNRCVLVTIF